MENLLAPLALVAATATAALATLPKIAARIQLSRGKHRSLAGHSKMSRQIAKWIPFYEYEGSTFFATDKAPETIAMRRKHGFMRLAELYATRYPNSARMTAEVADGISDLQFTSNYRVPFQYSRFVREHIKGGVFLSKSEGVFVIDLDGNELFDLTGSYGVNVFGYDFYKACIERGAATVCD